MKLLTDAIITTVSLALWAVVYFFGVVAAGILFIAFPGLFILVGIGFIYYMGYASRD